MLTPLGGKEISNDEGRATPLISTIVSKIRHRRKAYMAFGSRRIVNEKQHGIPFVESSSSGLLSVQLVSIAF